MEQEATQELVDRQGHASLLVAVSGISPAEGDSTVGESNEPVVGEGDPMGIAVAASIQVHSLLAFRHLSMARNWRTNRRNW
jgi:hypothetical protein